MIMGKTQQGKWELVALGDITDVASGAGFPARFQGNESGEYPFYKVSDMNLGGNEIWMHSHNNAIDEGVRCEMKAKAYPKGTIIFPKIGAAIATNKKRILSRDACFDNNVIGILPSKNLDTGYLYHLLLCKDLSDFANTGNPPSIRKTTLEQWEVPLPPLEEQKRIAKILDTTDALRTKRRESLAQLDSLLQSTFLEHFGDPIYNPESFQTKPVGSLCRLVRGSSPRPKGDPRYYGGDVPRLMVGDITRDGFWVTPQIDSLTEEGAKKGRPVPEGTVVMAVSGNVGVVSRVRTRCCVHDGFVAFLDLDASQVDATYFLYHLHMIKAKHEGRLAGAIFKNLTTKDIKQLEILLPDIDAQKRFASFVAKLESQAGIVKSHSAELDKLFASLQTRAFSGDL